MSNPRRILRGDRNLTLAHVCQLAAHFHFPPELFASGWETGRVLLGPPGSTRAFKVNKVDNPTTPVDPFLKMPATRERWGLVLPSNEQAVVDEFSGVIRRYLSLNQDPTVLARLVGVAFNRSIGAKESRGNKLARAQLRGLEVRQQLAESEGGSLSSDEVARLLRISKTAVLKRLAAGRLIAWREERLQAARFPRWQFDDHGQVLPGLEEVLGILNENGRIDPWGKILFFLQSRNGPDGMRPLDQLREGQVKDVVLAARAYAE